MRPRSLVASAVASALVAGAACVSIGGLSGGSPGDAGAEAAVDAGVGVDVATPSEAGQAACAPGAFLFCDPFDQPSDTANWTFVDPANGTATIDTSIAHRGTGSLHMHHAATSGALSILEDGHKDAVLPTDLFVRIFARFSWSIDVGEFLAIGEASGASAVHLYGGKVNGAPRIFVGTYGSGITAADLGSDFSAPPGQWICFEVEADSAAGSVRAWADGVQLAALNASFSVKLALVGVGLTFDATATQPERDVWFDDVAYDTQRIGCER